MPNTENPHDRHYWRLHALVTHPDSAGGAAVTPDEHGLLESADDLCDRARGACGLLGHTGGVSRNLTRRRPEWRGLRYGSDLPPAA